jgi:hypothetical protein
MSSTRPTNISKGNINQQQSSSSLSSKRRLQTYEEATTMRRQTTAEEGKEEEEEEKGKKTERRRKQCRISQRRYRDKKGSFEYNLQLDVNSLREHVSRLQSTCQLLQSKIFNDRKSTLGPLMKTVRQYYEVFHHGLKDPGLDTKSSLAKYYKSQVDFLDCLFDQDIRFGSAIGIPVIREQWRRYASFHSGFTIDVLSTEIIDSEKLPLIRVKLNVRARINRTTIMNMFPHVLENEELVQELIGKEVEYMTRAEFEFDDKGQAVRHEVIVDFLTGLNQVLGSPIQTAKLLQKAFIADNCLIGPIETSSLGKAYQSVELLSLSCQEEDINHEEILQKEEEEGTMKTTTIQPSTFTTTPSKTSTTTTSSRLDLDFIMS